MGIFLLTRLPRDHVKKKIKFAQKKKRTDYKMTFKFYSWNAA